MPRSAVLLVSMVMVVVAAPIRGHYHMPLPAARSTKRGGTVAVI